MRQQAGIKKTTEEALTGLRNAIENASENNFEMTVNKYKEWVQGVWSAWSRLKWVSLWGLPIITNDDDYAKRSDGISKALDRLGTQLGIITKEMGYSEEMMGYEVDADTFCRVEGGSIIESVNRIIEQSIIYAWNLALRAAMQAQPLHIRNLQNIQEQLRGTTGINTQTKIGTAWISIVRLMKTDTIRWTEEMTRKSVDIITVWGRTEDHEAREAISKLLGLMTSAAHTVSAGTDTAAIITAINNVKYRDDDSETSRPSKEETALLAYYFLPLAPGQGIKLRDLLEEEVCSLLDKGAVADGGRPGLETNPRSGLPERGRGSWRSIIDLRDVTGVGKKYDMGTSRFFHINNTKVQDDKLKLMVELNIMPGGE